VSENPYAQQLRRCCSSWMQQGAAANHATAPCRLRSPSPLGRGGRGVRTPQAPSRRLRRLTTTGSGSFLVLNGGRPALSAAKGCASRPTPPSGPRSPKPAPHE